ncbi:hypothetical protein [Portibacter lacus]|uniref:Cytochrome c domain-containing protein n=1 Tax=Portibacter lacus TaxID=1099794 RepID=A0AA37SJ19_9BACT|nr:hypothetical protein [Portibacter lacus]GLR15623.1 hypothetical protein GCM10007940_02380 [Portibacter lacus]
MKFRSILLMITLLTVVMVSYNFNEVAEVQLEEQSMEAFGTMMEVVMHKRCMNCHPKGDQPRQGEDSHLHYFGVQRGEDGHGIAALKCETCHQKENNLNSGVPGAPHWHLAPRSMAWEGLSRTEVASVFMNPETNGGKSPEEIEKHMTEDDLVLWAFEPGIGLDGVPREKPPVSKEEFIEAVKIWIANGAKIPSE